MNEQNFGSFMWVFLMALVNLCLSLGMLSNYRKPLRGIREAMSIEDRNGFLQAVNGFLDMRLSCDPTYAASPPLNALELQSFYRKWVQRYDKNPWIIIPVVLFFQLLLGIVALRHGESVATNASRGFLIASSIVVLTVAGLCAWRVSKKVAALRSIDNRLDQYSATDRKDFVESSAEEKAAQAYTLSAINSVPQLVTAEDIAANPRSLAEASGIIRGGVAFLAGIGFFLAMVFGGGVSFIELAGMDESIFPVFLITGFVGMLIIWFGLMIYWSGKRQKLAQERGQGERAGQAPGYPPAFDPLPHQLPLQLPYPSSPQPLPARAGTLCGSCGMMISRDAATCPHCGSAPRPA